MKRFLLLMMLLHISTGVSASTITSVKTKPCIGLKKLKTMIANEEDVTHVNTECITDMSYLFRNNKVFNQDISHWDTSNVINMRGMFNNALKFNQPIGRWDVSNVTNMQAMFSLATSFDQNIGGWDISNVTDMRYMFYRVSLSRVNYDALLRGWSQKNVNAYITFDGGESHYSVASQIFRKKLVDRFHWKITDNGIDTVIKKTVIKKQSIRKIQSKSLQSKAISTPVKVEKRVIKRKIIPIIKSKTQTQINKTLVKEKSVVKVVKPQVVRRTVVSSDNKVVQTKRIVKQLPVSQSRVVTKQVKAEPKK